MGIRDYDSGKGVIHMLRVMSNVPLSGQLCSCKGVKPHAVALRQERRPEEVANGEDSPHQKSLSDWVDAVIRLLDLRPGGQRVDWNGVITSAMETKKDRVLKVKAPLLSDRGETSGPSPVGGRGSGPSHPTK